MNRITIHSHDLPFRRASTGFHSQSGSKRPAQQRFQNTQKAQRNVPVDRLLDYSWLDKTVQRLKIAFLTTPKTVLKGIRGDSDYSFSEQMLVSRIPYYIGGAVLTLSFLAGGNKREGVRQGVAVLFYLLGIAGSNAFVNTLYRYRYGMDLSMMYRSKKGNVEYVFASSDFPRFDLLTPKHYNTIGDKLDIPKNIPDRDGAVREELRNIINRSRVLKLLVGNIMAAIGAGYLARTHQWSETLAALRTLPQILKTPNMPPLQKMRALSKSFFTGITKPLVEKLSFRNLSAWQKATYVIFLGTLGLTLLLSKEDNPKNKEYGLLQKKHSKHAYRKRAKQTIPLATPLKKPKKSPPPSFTPTYLPTTGLPPNYYAPYYYYYGGYGQ